MSGSLRYATWDLLQRLAATLGAYATPATPRERVHAFVASLTQPAPEASHVPLVQIGDVGRGGYMVPDDLVDVAGLISPGVGDEVSFDAALVQRGIPCHLLDGSIAEAPLAGPLVTFDRRFVATSALHGPERVRLHDVVAGGVTPAHGDLILQMDVEGDEYGVLLDTPHETLRRFRIVVVEFHDVTRAASAHLLPFMQQAVDRLMVDFALVHARINETGGGRRVHGVRVPRLIEATFLRRDRLPGLSSAASEAGPAAGREDASST